MKAVRLTCAALAVLAYCGVSQAGSIIMNATKISGNATAINLSDGGLAEGVDAYTDRTHVLVNVPPELVGADLVQVSNSDKSSVPYELEVEMSNLGLGLLYVGLDDRLSGDDNTTPADPFAWMLDTAFTGLPDVFRDTGVNMDIDESNDGDIDQTFSLWVALAPAGTYTLGAQDFGGNNYIVFGSDTLVKPVPEPSTLLLAGLGLVGLGVMRRRMRSC